ncbi:MAG: sarcosine oxidase subunit gamma family protein [Pseudomonadota bacterium]
MSDPVAALGGVEFAGGIARIEEVPLQGMITLRADLTDKMVAKALKSVVKEALPEVRRAAIKGDSGVAWMSPDELLILCPYADVADVLDKLDTALRGVHALAANVSDARGSFRISGTHARDVLAKLCPVNLAPEAFGRGDFRRTRMAQVPAALWQSDEESFQLICFRSQARYVFDLLSVAGQLGSEVHPA